MTQKTINCAECNVEYSYDEKAGYPRKYCANCSQKKKDSFKGNAIEDMTIPTGSVPTLGEGLIKPRTTRTAEEITCGEDMKLAKDIFVAGLEYNKNNPQDDGELMAKAIKLVKQAKEGLQ